MQIILLGQQTTTEMKPKVEWHFTHSKAVTTGSLLTVKYNSLILGNNFHPVMKWPLLPVSSERTEVLQPYVLFVKRTRLMWSSDQDTLSTVCIRPTKRETSEKQTTFTRVQAPQVDE